MSDTTAPIVTITGGWRDHAPTPPDRQPIARIPEQPNLVQIIYAGDAPNPEDLERARIARRRPADRSARAIGNALDAVVADKAIATTRLAVRRDAAKDAFDMGATPVQVKAARDAVDVAQIELDQLGAMEAGLRVSLARAKEEEAAEVAALIARVPAAEATVSAFRRFIEQDYPKYSAKIAAGLALESQAEDAMRTLRAATHHVAGMAAPEDLPLVPNGTLKEAYRLRASLPGTDVQPLAKWAPPGAAFSY